MNRRTFGQLVAGAAAAQTLSHSMAFAAPVATPPSGFHFSVMLWTLTKALTVDQALEVVAAAGFKGVELVGEYKKWSPEDSRRIKASLSRLGLTIDSNAPGRVNLPDPSAWPAINDLITTAIPITRDLGCSQIILTSGNRVPTVTPEVEHQAIIDNLKRIADIATKENFEIVLEPIDLLENKNSYVTSVTDGFEIVRAVGSPNVKVLYDFYHEQRGAGNVIEKLDKNIDLVGLVHIADVPGRHEPGSGEMNYTNIYRKLASLKYNRFIAMEFYPTGDPTTQLKAARLAAIEAEHSV
jgi:hydroxypyruvate isomerase